MEVKDYLRMLQKEMHSSVVATLNADGHPETRAIDIMLADENSIYIITPKGKKFYQQLINNPYISITSMSGDGGTMSKKAISIRGKIMEITRELLPVIFEENPYLNDIYKTEQSKEAIRIFKLSEGQGEYFDLTTQPMTHHAFVLGNTKLKCYQYIISDKCNGCGYCAEICSQKCITNGLPYVIQQEHCMHCAICVDNCPKNAIMLCT